MLGFHGPGIHVPDRYAALGNDCLFVIPEACEGKLQFLGGPHQSGPFLFRNFIDLFIRVNAAALYDDRNQLGRIQMGQRVFKLPVPAF